MLHKHRILPGHMGGTYTPENVVLLSIQKHAEAHHQLFLEHGHTADFVAWKMLSGQMGKEAAFLTIQRSPECRAKKSLSLQGHNTSPETRQKIGLAAKGRKGHWTGKTFSDETRQKIGLASKGRTLGCKRPDVAERNRLRKAV